jgi:hypothetical protein
MRQIPGACANDCTSRLNIAASESAHLGPILAVAARRRCTVPYKGRAEDFAYRLRWRVSAADPWVGSSDGRRNSRLSIGYRKFRTPTHVSRARAAGTCTVERQIRRELRMNRIQVHGARWLVATLLILANLAMAGSFYREARAQAVDDSPCSEPGHCNCYDDGSGPFCSHVMGQNDPCTGPGSC